MSAGFVSQNCWGRNSASHATPASSCFCKNCILGYCQVGRLSRSAMIVQHKKFTPDSIRTAARVRACNL